MDLFDSASRLGQGLEELPSLLHWGMLTGLGLAVAVPCEAEVFRRLLHLPRGPAYRAALLANAGSALLGMPGAWAVVFMCWPAAREGWPLTFHPYTLVVGFLLASLVEGGILRRIKDCAGSSNLTRAVYTANLSSHLLFFFLARGDFRLIGFNEEQRINRINENMSLKAAEIRDSSDE